MEEKSREETKYEGVERFHPLTEASIISALEKMKKERKVVTGFFPIDLREEFYIFYKKRDLTEPSEEDLIKSREPKVVERETIPTPEINFFMRLKRDYFFLIVIVIILIIVYLVYNGYV